MDCTHFALCKSTLYWPSEFLISPIDIKNQIVQPVLAELTWPTVYILVPVKMCNLSVYKFQTHFNLMQV